MKSNVKDFFKNVCFSIASSLISYAILTIVLPFLFSHGSSSAFDLGIFFGLFGLAWLCAGAYFMYTAFDSFCLTFKNGK